MASQQHEKRIIHKTPLLRSRRPAHAASFAWIYTNLSGLGAERSKIFTHFCLAKQDWDSLLGSQEDFSLAASTTPKALPGVYTFAHQMP
jgi:hypothetical protein